MRIVVLSGGVGGARFALGLREFAAAGGHDITAIVNTGDDMWLAGLRITPDLDSLLYALAGVNDAERGWGRAGETERVAAELAEYGVGWPWFTLGDLDLGTHIARTAWLRDGVPLSSVVERLSRRWPLGVRLLPATDQEAETHALLPGGGSLHFEEWWTRHRGDIETAGFEYRDVERAAPAPGVLEAIGEADVVLLAPSNPVVSIAPILAVPGIRDALASGPAPVVGVSPIIGGAVVRGMADRCLSVIGVGTTALAVAEWYGARRDGGVLDGWLVAEEDAAVVPQVESLGIAPRAVPLWMRSPELTARMAEAAIALSGA